MELPPLQWYIFFQSQVPALNLNFCSYSLNFVLHTTERIPLAILQITTARKAVTLLLSYLIFTKPLTEQHGTGLILISMGIVLKMIPENKPVPRSVPRMKELASAKEENRRNEEEEERRPLVWSYKYYLLGFCVWVKMCREIYSVCCLLLRWFGWAWTII